MTGTFSTTVRIPPQSSTDVLLLTTIIVDNLTGGSAIYVSAEVGASEKLTFVNEAGNAIIKVDNTTKLSDGKFRNTVRIQTNALHGMGSLWVADMLHVPYGCR